MKHYKYIKGSVSEEYCHEKCLYVVKKVNVQNHIKMYNNILAFLFEKTVHKRSFQFHLLSIYSMFINMHKILEENKISGY